MTKYLISFPSAAMIVPDEELQAVSDAAHAAVQEAKDAAWTGPRRSPPPAAARRRCGPSTTIPPASC